MLGIYNICANDYAERAYGIIHRKHRYNQETVFIILSVIRYHLWSIRCMKTFGKDNQSIDQTISKILREIVFIKVNEIQKKSLNEKNWFNFDFSISNSL
ncbi:hypothetical protein XELAEV_18043684mg [Xenopus laevis]|uniref:Uncharacterized protein n=1 Tax=Xenopus laevis TaxID=8355 RepID=A0A974H344_XENLA|nr:hypothetical protein XELAEV_18043684mg [Xenopus laevis]